MLHPIQLDATGKPAAAPVPLAPEAVAMRRLWLAAALSVLTALALGVRWLRRK